MQWDMQPCAVRASIFDPCCGGGSVTQKGLHVLSQNHRHKRGRFLFIAQARVRYLGPMVTKDPYERNRLSHRGVNNGIGYWPFRPDRSAQRRGGLPRSDRNPAERQTGALPLFGVRARVEIRDGGAGGRGSPKRMITGYLTTAVAGTPECATGNGARPSGRGVPCIRTSFSGNGRKLTRSSRIFQQDRIPAKTPSGPSRCQAKTSKRKQCRGWARLGGLCHIHDPHGTFQNSGKNNRIGRVNYHAYLQSEHWIRFRRKALAFHGNRCLTCGASPSDATLQVHHRNYGCLWHETMDDVLILCKTCHRNHHKKEVI